MSAESLSLDPRTEILRIPEVVHLLRRAMFGVDPQMVLKLEGKTPGQIIERLLEPSPFNNGKPLNDYDVIGIQVAPGTSWTGHPYNEEEDGHRLASFRKWMMGVMLRQDFSVQEKMILFWHNHFATQSSIGRSDLLWDHFQLLREEALGNFKNLTRKLITDCHMLRYLNGEENTSSAPNENFARELQELFCIGKGPDAQFTEMDVREAARVLSGWKVDYEKRQSWFKASDHDPGNKRFSPFYGERVIPGTAGEEGGKKENELLLDMLFENKETSKFICRKIYRWFVSDEVGDEIEENIIIPLSKVLKENDYEVKPMLSALLNSRHFFDARNRGALIKGPIDFCIGLQRDLGVKYSSEEFYRVNYSMYEHLMKYCTEMGQAFGEPPSVAGWPAYYQLPLFGRLWINTSTYSKRVEFAGTFTDFGFNREGVNFGIDVISFARKFKSVADPGLFIRELASVLYNVTMPDDDLMVLKKKILLSGQEGDHYWIDAWQDHQKDPEDEVKRSIVEIRLRQLVKHLVTAPEYQLA